MMMVCHRGCGHVTVGWEVAPSVLRTERVGSRDGRLGGGALCAED